MRTVSETQLGRISSRVAMARESSYRFLQEAWRGQGRGGGGVNSYATCSCLRVPACSRSRHSSSAVLPVPLLNRSQRSVREASSYPLRSIVGSQWSSRGWKKKGHHRHLNSDKSIVIYSRFFYWIFLIQALFELLPCTVYWGMQVIDSTLFHIPERVLAWYVLLSAVACQMLTLE